MIVRAVQFLAIFGLALLHLIGFWMENKFFPTMTLITFFSSTACFYIIGNRLILVPFFATLGFVVVNFTLAPVVLPVVSVNASIPFMIFFVIRTPLRFIVKYVEVFVSLELLN